MEAWLWPTETTITKSILEEPLTLKENLRIIKPFFRRLFPTALWKSTEELI
jgi:hypothetical protein